MTMAITRSANHYECNGAQVRAHCRHLATVVTIRGDVDAVNVDQLSNYIRRFVQDTNPVVLDLSEVSQFSAAGVSLLDTFDEDCRISGVEWTLVPGPAVTESLGIGADIMFSTASSVHEALGNRADAIASRRRLVLPLIKKSA